MELSDFLLARIAEDEAGATIPMHPDAGMARAADAPSVDRGIAAGGVPRWTAARVLAECEAKRAVVAHHAKVPSHAHPGYDCSWCRMHWPCFDLHILAAPYADHEDYQPEWKP